MRRSKMEKRFYNILAILGLLLVGLLIDKSLVLGDLDTLYNELYKANVSMMPSGK